MKLLWHSNAPWSTTGYGTQTGLFAPLLKTELGHDVAISAFWGLGGKPLEWNDGIKIYPSDDAWGNRWLPVFAADHGAGDPFAVTVITLMDVWVLTAHTLLKDLNLASWVPVDHEPAPPRVVDFFRKTGSIPIAMSKFGERMLQEERLDPLYVPHGVDTELFRPLDQAQVREQLGIPADVFVVGMVAANKGNSPPRKAFPQVFEAFAAFHKEHPDSLLYLHTLRRQGQSDLNLPAVMAQCGVPPDSVMFTPEFALALGVDADRLVEVYACFDVLANPSYGEGFGIPIIDAQACGVPVIVNDFSSMPELCGAGWLVGNEPWYDPSQGAWFRSPRVGDIYAALKDAYRTRGQHRERAREFALQYDARRVLQEFWEPALAEIDRRVGERRDGPVMPRVTVNRAERRRRSRARA